MSHIKTYDMEIFDQLQIAVYLAASDDCLVDGQFRVILPHGVL